MFKKNRFGSSSRKKGGIFGIIIPVLFLGAMVVMLNIGVNHLTESHSEESINAVRNAISRASVQYYTLNGRYPHSVEYLAEQFGLQLDFDRFIIHFEAFGSNIPPQIVVLHRDF